MNESIIEYEIKPIRIRYYLFLIATVFIYIISFFVFSSYFIQLKIDFGIYFLFIFLTISSIWSVSENINKIFSRKIKGIIYRILSNENLKLELLNKVDDKLEKILSNQIKLYKKLANISNIIAEHKEVVKMDSNYKLEYIFFVSIPRKKEGKYYLIIFYNPEKLVSSVPDDFQIFHTDQYSIIRTDKTLDLTIWAKRKHIKKVIQNISTVINYISTLNSKNK